jgi:DNA-binding CsgD family transcriptional regulator
MAFEALQAAGWQGAATDWLVATPPAADIPFGALARWLPEDDTLTHLTVAGVALFQAAARQLSERAGGAPLVVGIDDVAHLDPASAVLLHHLVCSRLAKLVLTLRTGEPVPEPITNLSKEGLLTRIELGSLTRPEVDDLVALALDGPPDPGLSDQLWKISSGNLLYLRELLTAASEAGVLEPRDGHWHLRGKLPTSSHLVELVEARIGALTDGERDALDLLSLSEPLALDVLERLAPAETVERLERAELLVHHQDQSRHTVSLTHPLYAEVLRDRCGRLRSRALARRLATAHFETGLRRRGDLLRYVVWQLDGGGACDSPLLRQGASQALEAADPELAVRLARAALNADPADLRAALILTEALARQGRFDDCLALLDSLAPLEGADHILVRRTRIVILFWAMGRAGEAEAELTQLEGQVTDQESRLLLVATRSAMLLQGGEALRAATLARAVLDQPCSPRAEWEAKQRLCMALAMMGRTDEALALAAQCLEPAARPEVVVPPSIEPSVAAIVLGSFYAGRIDITEMVGDRAYAEGLSLDHPPVRLVGAVTRGTIALTRGDLVLAGRLMTEAMSLLVPEDIDGLRDMVCGVRAYVAALSGQVELAEETLAAAAGHANPNLRWFEPVLEQGRAWTLAAAGRTGRAVEHLEALADDLSRKGQWALEATLRFDAARLGAGPAGAERLAELAGQNDGPFPPLAARYARGRLDGAGTDLDEVAAGFEALGMLVFAAMVAGDGAAAHRAAGNRVAEARSTRRCRDLAGRCPGLAPWVLHDRLTPDPLTNREREVARLVAAGQTNKAVADHLSISIRTVESHLERVFSKLGLNDRAQLTDAYGRGAEPEGSRPRSRM